MDREVLIQRLAAAGCVAPAAEAAGLLRAAPRDDATLERWVRRREFGEPLEWIVERVRFHGLELAIVPGVFVPRPQTEALVARAARLLPAGGIAADLCTGCGAVAAALRSERPASRVLGVDIDPAAAACARRNGVSVVVGDLDRPLRTGVFDVVTAVAPYVPTGEIAVPARRMSSDTNRRWRSTGERTASTWFVAWSARRPVCCALVVGCDRDRRRARTPASCRRSTSHGFTDVTTWSDDEGALRGLAATKPGG